MVKRIFLFLFLTNALFLLKVPKILGANPNIFLYQSQTIFDTGVITEPAPESIHRKTILPLLEPLSAIEKIFNTNEKAEEFEKLVQEIYQGSSNPDGSSNPNFNLGFALNQIRKLELLRQFGYDFFSLEPLTFTPPSNQPAGPDYILGPGDEVTIQIWGMVSGNYRSVIGNDGELSLQHFGKIPLAGKTLAEATDLITRSIGRYYKDFQISVGLGKLKIITVFVTGEVNYPGSYQMGGLSTLLNALYFSGGPAKNGSLRKIKLVRGGKTLGYFDFYQFLLSGDKSQDYRLQSGDVIFVEPIGKVVAIWGNQVKKPGIYEIPDKTTLKKLIADAGGLLNLGASPQIKVGFLNDQQPEGTSKILSLEEDYLFKGGETVLISSDILGVKKYNIVMVEGEVVKPGKYVLEEGERINSLLKRAGGFTENAFLGGVVFTRKSIQEIQQENLDRFAKTQMELLINTTSFQTTGINIDALTKEQAMINQLVSRLTPGRIRVNLAKLIDTREDFILEDGDTLFVPKTPEAVYLVGAINSQGAITYAPDKSLAWYVNRCGGYSPYVDKNGIFIIHPDGTADARISGSYEVRRGDTIIIPEKIRLSRWTLTKEIATLFYQIALPAAALWQ